MKTSTPLVLPFFYALFMGEGKTSDHDQPGHDLSLGPPSPGKDTKIKKKSIRQQKK